MRLCSTRSDIRALLVLLALCGAAFICPEPHARAQGLDLPPRIESPDLDGPTYTDALIAALEQEIAHFTALDRQAGGSQRTAIRASINIRIIAAELLSRGAHDDLLAHGIPVLTGLHLAHGRAELDQAIIAIHRSHDQRRQAAGEGADDSLIARALQRLARFNESAVDYAHALRSGDAEEMDAALELVFEPFAEALMLATACEPATHWPVKQSPIAPAPKNHPVAALRVRLRAADPPEELHDALEQMLALENDPSARQFHEAKRAAADVIALLEAAHAQGLSTSDIDEVHTAALEAARAWLDPLTRHTGRARCAHLAHCGTILADVGALRAWKVDGRPLLEAWGRIVSMDAPPSAIESRDALMLVIDRMIAFRETPKTPETRELVVTSRKLKAAYLQSERAMLTSLRRLGSDDFSPLTDPAFIAQLAEHGRRLDDLLHLHQVPRWIDAMRMIDPVAGRQFDKQIKRLCAHLAEPRRRDASAEALARFDAELAMFHPLPFEGALTASEQVAIEATGGLHAELLDELHRGRSAWARAWAAGENQTEATRRMTLLYELMSIMADAARFSANRHDDAALLNRWAAWDMPSDLLLRSATDVPNRVKLAAAAATQGLDRPLRDQLERLKRDAGLVRLVGELTRRLGDALEPLPDGACGVAGQLAQGPGDDAMLVDLRDDLAVLCRVATEADDAWTAGRDDDALKLQDLANALIDRLLADLAPHEPPPARR
jgi:hypothetical protein